MNFVTYNKDLPTRYTGIIVTQIICELPSNFKWIDSLLHQVGSIPNTAKVTKSLRLERPYTAEEIININSILQNENNNKTASNDILL